MSGPTPNNKPAEVSIEGKEIEQETFPDHRPKITHEDSSHYSTLALKVHPPPAHVPL